MMYEKNNLYRYLYCAKQPFGTLHNSGNTPHERAYNHYAPLSHFVFFFLMSGTPEGQWMIGIRDHFQFDFFIL